VPNNQIFTQEYVGINFLAVHKRGGIWMDNSVVDTLKKARLAEEVVAIYTDISEPDKFSAGFVDQIDDTWIRLRSISSEGEDDGYEVRALKDIFKIAINGRYEQKIDFISNNREDVFKNVELDHSVEMGVAVATLKEAQEKELIANFWMRAEGAFHSVTGYVDNLDQDIVRILEVDNYGQEDGVLLLDLNQVVGVSCNDLRCQMIKFLNKNWRR
jgi:hypothetical protein